MNPTNSTNPINPTPPLTFPPFPLNSRSKIMDKYDINTFTSYIKFNIVKKTRRGFS